MRNGYDMIEFNPGVFFWFEGVFIGGCLAAGWVGYLCLIDCVGEGGLMRMVGAGRLNRRTRKGWLLGLVFGEREREGGFWSLLSFDVRKGAA